MTANAWQIYDSFPERMGDGGHDLDNDEFKVALFLVGSNCATATLDQFSELTSEHAAQYGYAAGGQVLDNVTWVEVAGTTTLDANAEVFSAVGGSILCRFAAIFNNTHVDKLLVASSLLDNAPADVEATDGNTLTITPHASGIFSIAQA